VLFFSVLRDIAGDERIRCVVEGDPVILVDLMERLFEDFPQLRDWEDRLLVAVNCEYAKRDTALKEGDEIALMPPVQGG
jgi:molybdopterin converting factor small subunit